MAKTRAQRKAERRAREAEERKRSGDHPSPTEAQHDTQVPISGDEALVEARERGMAAGVSEEALRLPDDPKPSRSDRRAEAKALKETEKRKREEQKRREREQLAKRQKQAKTERQRGGFIGFLISCWAELKKVQWPDRETLIQATAVTILFVAVAAAYLGALDAAFSWLINKIL
ncbi:MAG TPA: preprotein translocase subunit SecE [Solirubrobacterales bacterium]|nr:preprotein translocase subunit SecE [Solirubrobacterales bacterium]